MGTGAKVKLERNPAALKRGGETARSREDETPRTFFTHSPIGIYLVQDGKFKFVNSVLRSLLGRGEDELLNTISLDVVHPDDRQSVRENAIKMLKGERTTPYEYRVVGRNGEITWVTESVASIEYQGRRAVLGHYIDITEQKQAQEQLRESEAKYHTFFKTSRDSVFITSRDGKWLDFNDAAVELFGCRSKEELENTPFPEFHVNPKDRRVFCQLLDKRGFVQDFAVNFRRKDGKIINAMVTAVVVRDKGGKIIGYQGTVKDITERRRGEERLLRMYEMTLAIRRVNQLIAVITDEKDMLKKVCATLVNRRQYSGAWIGFLTDSSYDIKLVAQEGLAVKYQPSVKMTWDDSKYSNSPAGIAIKTGHPAAIKDVLNDERYLPWRQEAQEYGYRSVAALPLVIEGRIRGVLNVCSWETSTFDGTEMDMLLELAGDISLGIEKIRQEKSLKESITRLAEAERIARLGNWDWDIVHNKLIWSDEIYRIFGLEPQQFGATHEAFLSSVHPDDREKVNKEVEAVLHGQRDYRIEHRIVLPDGSERIVLELAEAVFSKKGKALRMLGTVHDITELSRAKEALHKSYDRMQRVLQGTVQAMAAIVESRDLYTAGHQRRVARLSRAIAGELKLSEERVENLYTAAIMHDVGKIQIPAEILSKPASLTEAEFNIVKTHPAVGFNILQNIEFPGPVAEIVLQHHERADGSGYPQGIDGQEILLESCILAVADVVEAISSHRPYRPSLGVETALQEISQGSGTVYNPEVVDACLRLFQEKGFQLD